MYKQTGTRPVTASITGTLWRNGKNVAKGMNHGTRTKERNRTMMEMSPELTASVLENCLKHGKFNIPLRNAIENAVRLLKDYPDADFCADVERKEDGKENGRKNGAVCQA